MRNPFFLVARAVLSPATKSHLRAKKTECISSSLVKLAPGMFQPGYEPLTREQLLQLLQEGADETRKVRPVTCGQCPRRKRL